MQSSSFRSRIFAASSLALALLAMPLAGIMSPGTAVAQGPRTPGVLPACAIQPDDLGAFAFASTITPAPAIGAKSAAVLSSNTGQVLYELHGRARLAPASTTKIMTAVISLESIVDEGQIVDSTTDASDMPESSVMGLWPHAPVTYRDLLYGLMLPSGNDAALDLARHLGPTEKEFVARMNAKAVELGMGDTHFSNPHGLDAPDHYSSARDLALLGRYAMANTRFREIAATAHYHLPAPFDYGIHNGNSMLGTYPGANGIKIGWTDNAGWTFIASAVRHGQEVVVSLLDAPERDADATALLNWAFEAHEWDAIDASTFQVFETLSMFSGVNIVDRLIARCPN